MKAKERRKPENLPKKRLEVSKLMPSWKEPLDCYFFLCVGCKFIARCLHGHTPKPLDRVGNFFPKALFSSCFSTFCFRLCNFCLGWNFSGDWDWEEFFSPSLRCLCKLATVNDACLAKPVGTRLPDLSTMMILLWHMIRRSESRSF